MGHLSRDPCYPVPRYCPGMGSVAAPGRGRADLHTRQLRLAVVLPEPGEICRVSRASGNDGFLAHVGLPATRLALSRCDRSRDFRPSRAQLALQRSAQSQRHHRFTGHRCIADVHRAPDRLAEPNLHLLPLLRMPLIGPHQQRWLRVFGATLAVLLSAAVVLSLRLPSFREPVLNFYAMKPGEIFNVYGLTRRQEGSVKLGFAEAYPGPEIGLYGNHIAAFFGAEAFGHPEDAEYFFNYSYANLSLPEIRRYLLHVAQLNHLPKKLILIQITPPNADNGGFIIDHGNELPPDIFLSTIESDERSNRLLPLVTLSWELVRNWLHEILNYNTVIMSLF